MLDNNLFKIYTEHLKKNPGTYIIPEPPRGNTIRLYNKRAQTPFLIIGDNPPKDWRCLAKSLDLTKNYWEKKPVSNEILWTSGTTLMLIKPEDEKYLACWKDAKRSGPALFEEDQHDLAVLELARERGQIYVEEFKSIYEEQLIKGLAALEPLPTPTKRKGRPKGSKNKVKELNNEKR